MGLIVYFHLPMHIFTLIKHSNDLMFKETFFIFVNANKRKHFVLVWCLRLYIFLCTLHLYFITHLFYEIRPKIPLKDKKLDPKFYQTLQCSFASLVTLRWQKNIPKTTWLQEQKSILKALYARIFEMCVEVLKQSENLLPLADGLNIITRCIDAIASKACAEQIASSFSRLEKTGNWNSS